MCVTPAFFATYRTSGTTLPSFLGGDYPNYTRPLMPASTVIFDALHDCHAAGDGRSDDTAAIQACIDRCAQRAGFATVLLPRGHSFVSGALNLTSHLLTACFQTRSGLNSNILHYFLFE